jgi:chaperonin GroEL
MIVANAGLEPAVVVEKVRNGTGNFGYNARSDEYGDLWRDGRARPHQGHPVRAAERGVRGEPAAHHRGDGRRDPQEEEAGRGGGGHGGGMGGMDF